MMTPGKRLGITVVFGLVCIGAAWGLEIRKPSGVKAWLLPEPGQGGVCLEGNVRDIRFSPSGNYLAAEVEDKFSAGLCLYKLNDFDPTRASNQVERYRVSAVGSASPKPGAPAPATSSWGKKGRFAREEMELRFSPYADDLSYTGEKWVAPLVFSLSESGQPDRIMGALSLGTLRSAGGSTADKVVALDGRKRDLSSGGRGDFYQPTFNPQRRQSITVVTNAGLDCGRSRIASLENPRCEESTCKPTLLPLTTPCRPGSSATEANTADRYPAWDPVAEHDRLAFVRVTAGVRAQVCLQPRPFERPQPPLRCFGPATERAPVSRIYPTFSADGRYLAFFEVATVEKASGSGQVLTYERTTVHGVDLNSPACAQLADPACKPVELESSVGLNAGHGPTLLTVAGRTWLLAARENDKGRVDDVVARALEGGAARQIVTDVSNIRSIDVVTVKLAGREQHRLALVAQGYRNVEGADQDRLKVFVMPLPEDW